MNRTVGNMLRQYCQKSTGTWDEFLPSISLAYNSSLNQATGFSPYYLTFGRDPMLPNDVISGPLEPIRFDLEQYQTRLTYSLRQAFEIAKKNISKEQLRLSKALNSRSRYLKLSEGDKVILHTPVIRKPNDLIQSR